MAERVAVREVGPRDGLQNFRTIMPMAAKCDWIAAMAASGIVNMEAASFVPPSAMPQMAEAAQVVRSVRETIPTSRTVALAGC